MPEYPPNPTRNSGLPTEPPPPHSEDLEPGVIESYVRAAMHRDRAPGSVLAVCHPLRMYKVPRRLFDLLRMAGFHVEIVETQRDRAESVRGIRDALRSLSERGDAIDVLVFSGDGSLDHHVLVAAFWAFYPELVTERKGALWVEPPTEDELDQVPTSIRQAFLEPLPNGAGLATNEANLHAVWVLRARIEGLVGRGASPERIARRAGLPRTDPLLRLAVAAVALPQRTVLRADGFDLSRLARATQEHTFQGLYPYLRSIAAYPCGTAADNALYAGVPGWAYAQASRFLVRWTGLDGLRRWWEERAQQRFLAFFTRDSVVVPARFSIVAFDGDWQVLSSHAAGGPGGGRFFAADLESKTGGLLGYLARIPSVLVKEGLLGRTIVRVKALSAAGREKFSTEARLVEGLYTNRTFIAGVGSVPATNPTSFAGHSSLVLGPPIWYRDTSGTLQVDFRGLLSFVEAIVKGVVARAMHGMGMGVGRLAGGGRFAAAAPEHQVTLTEGEVVDMSFLDLDRRPRFVPTQVSGDPFQATRMTIRVAWGPLPLLAATDSLLLAAAQRSLSRLRQARGWRVRSVFIGGLHWFRHLVGPEWSPELCASTGLFAPPRHLPRRLGPAQKLLLARWRQLGTGGFVDTTEQGLALGRRGRYAHNSDQSAHLVVLRERSGTLLVRQVRRAGEDGAIFEARSLYRSWWGGWVIHESQARRWRPSEQPVLLQEEHYFRDAEAFRLEAPAFFPFVSHGEEEVVWHDITDERPLRDLESE